MGAMDVSEHFPWDPALETGDLDIDEQHRGLFRLANELQDALEHHAENEELLTDAVYALTDYCVDHFTDEQDFMERCGYPGAGPHRSLHDHFTAEALRIVSRFVNGETVAVEELAPFLTSWLTEHIEREDKRLVAFALGRESSDA